jgi:tRNA(Ile)-lysidine synthase TilS/MesJ
MQKMLSYIRRACDDYNMIEDGDKIAVGVSGGKDSVMLLAALCTMRRFYPKKYDIVAVILDPQFNGVQTDYAPIEKFCSENSVELVIKRTEIGKIIFEERREKSPCSLCARMRRGALHDAAIASGCNKIALGHHLDDVAETFIMNLFNGGTLDCFMPVTYLSRKDLYMIRPMIFARESDCARVVRKANLPIVKSKCPADGTTERQEVKEFLDSLEKKYGSVRHKILGAMQRKEINGY